MSLQVSTSVPSTRTMRSPAMRPLAAAGESAVMLPITFTSRGADTPSTEYTSTTSKKPVRIFTAIPATSMKARAQKPRPM